MRYSTLVFDTIRIGFPTARVVVAGNDLPSFAVAEIESACRSSGCEFENGQPTIHHEWIERLVETEKDPFFISDSDIIYYSKVEDWKFATALAGWRIPEFQDEFTGAITRSRLHTSLLFINPEQVKEEVDKYDAQFPVTPFNPPANLIYPLCIPLNGKTYFNDTLSFLYHAIGGTAFTAEQKDAFFHFNFGTISDIVLPRLANNEQLRAARDGILKHPELARGAWRFQEQHYASRQPIFDGGNVITPVKPEEAARAREWNAELCKGDAEAMSFGDLWYGYAHGIDDLLDTMKDGRPAMSKEQMISLFFCAALLYNHSFYMKHQRLLYPIILDTTNLYKLSVGWEGSPKPHLRAIADVLRSCGLKMHTMIALICGGEAHMIDITRRLYEQDWLGQHDERGQPI